MQAPMLNGSPRKGEGAVHEERPCSYPGIGISVPGSRIPRLNRVMGCESQCLGKMAARERS
jgi:hypothetical protein